MQATKNFVESYQAQDSPRSFLCIQMPATQDLAQTNKCCDLEPTIAEITLKNQPNEKLAMNMHPQCFGEIAQKPNQQNSQHEKPEIEPQAQINDSSQYEKWVDSKEANKQNEPVQSSQNPQQQSKVSYFIGEDEDEISDSEEVIESSQSSEEQDDQQQLQDDIEEEQDEQQQILQLDQNQLQESQDSDDQEVSQDEYPDDYDEQQETKFDKLFYSTSAQFKNQTTEQQFLMRYKALKQALEAEQHSIKQEQMVFGLVPLPLELQIKKMRINQGYLNLINKNYLIHLELEGGKRTNNNVPQNSKQDQSTSEYQTQACKIKPAKKVAFKEDIQMKMFKDSQQVTVLTNTQQQTQMMNIADKAPILKRFTTSLMQMSAPVTPKPPSVQNKTPLQFSSQVMQFSSQVIARFEEQLGKIDKLAGQQKQKEEQQQIKQLIHSQASSQINPNQQKQPEQAEKNQIVSALSLYENKENQIFVQRDQKQETQEAIIAFSKSDNQSHHLNELYQNGQHAALVQ